MKKNIVIVVGAIVLVVAVIAAVYAIGGAIFAFMWNLLAPYLFKMFGLTAPHMSWMAGIGAAWIIGIVQGIFGGWGRAFAKKD